MQGVQNPASLNLELPQQSVNQNGLLESNGEVNTSSSVLEEFNKNIQNGIGEVKDFVQDQITNPNNALLRVLPRKYEEQFNNVTQTTSELTLYHLTALLVPMTVTFRMNVQDVVQMTSLLSSGPAVT